jgi:hypothetical protein
MKHAKMNFEDFTNPPIEYRPVPFWGLNDDLTDDTLRYQIAEMKDKGWGGFFTHARYGLETPYLSNEYMDRMKTCVDEAKKQGIRAWIYDEHPFPAGCAGGLATACKKEYRHKALVMRMHNRLTPIDDEEAMGYFAVDVDKNGIPVNTRAIQNPGNYEGNEHHFMHFYIYTEPLHQGNQPGFSNYDDNIIHGFASSDNLNPNAVKKFIDVTYGSFKDKVGDEFGNTVMGGFSDIPVNNWNYATPHPSIPWTIGFEDYFKKNCGYDILPLLPSLFYNLGDYKKVRIDFWRTTNQLFVESFTKQLYEWCDKNQLLYIAHYWGEETLHWQIPWVGDAMTHFMYQHYVGMDHSIRNIEDPLGIKQAATVAEQLDKPRMVSETYGMSGNNLSHEERKWIGDWEYALGTNFLVPYVALYSFRGRRKRDEPASLFVQQAYWNDEKTLYDYYGRLSYALTAGERVVDTLVMQPLSSAWTMYTPQIDYPQAHRPDPLTFEGSSEELYSYNKTWMDLCDSMLAKHRDFHVGNESVMAEHGSVKNGQLTIGSCSYQVVIIPSSTSWSKNTVCLLSEFAKSGGTIIAVSPLPTLIHGVPADEVLPKETIVIDNYDGALEETMDKVLEKDILLPDCGDILYHHRKTGDMDLYYIANTSLSESYIQTEISIPGSGMLELWDAVAGKKFSLPSEQRSDKISFRLDFYPVSSYLIVRKDTADRGLEEYRPFPLTFQKSNPLANQWKLTLKDPNALVMDYCEAKVGSCPWTEKLPVWKAHRVVKQGGIGSRYTLRYHFNVAKIPDELKIVVETPDTLEVTVNGSPLKMEGNETWLDPDFHTYNIKDLVKNGINTVEMRGILGIGTDVENCILLGNMALDRENGFTISEPKAAVSGTDLTREGYPFFTGHAVLSQTFQIEKMNGRVFIAFDKVDTTLAKITVNGKEAGKLPWKPYILDITEYVEAGCNKVEIELITTRHNLFGPHHNKNGEVKKFCAPHIWTNELMWTDDYYFAPVGVTGAKILSD